MTSPLSIVHTESSIGWGGQEIRILTEARGMLERGHQVRLLTPANAAMLPAAKKMGVPVTAVNISKKRPAPLRPLFMKAGDVLNSHRGWDPGALPLARTLAFCSRHFKTYRYSPFQRLGNYD